MRPRSYFICLLASDSGVLYTGVTSDLKRRVWPHRAGQIEGFTRRYRAHRLVYFEEASDPRAAIAREKQINSWSRAKRVRLIEATNLGWIDLAAGWFERG